MLRIAPQDEASVCDYSINPHSEERRSSGASRKPALSLPKGTRISVHAKVTKGSSGNHMTSLAYAHYRLWLVARGKGRGLPVSGRGAYAHAKVFDHPGPEMRSR